MPRTALNIGGIKVPLTKLDKLYWPADGITKGMTLQYFARVGAAMVRHLHNRPLTVVRFPEGVEGEGFYQKDAQRHTPEWIPTYPVVTSETARTTRYILANHVAALLWLANQGAIEFHPWMSTIERPNSPTYAVIDLDPTEGAGFEDAREVAGLAKEWLDRLGLIGIAKTSGATGIHIQVPLTPIYTYEVTSRFVGLLGRLMEQTMPRRITTERLVRKRPRGTVYVDHLQNLPGKTIVSVYSPRPVPGAHVSAPFPWEELHRVQPDWFHVREPELVLKWAQVYDTIMASRQRLESALARLKAMGALDAQHP